MDEDGTVIGMVDDSSTDSGTGESQSQPYYDAQSQPEAVSQQTQNTCPITDKDKKPFRLMDMPAEVRIEIYRACLTRPYNVLLSKIPPPQPEPKKEEGEQQASDVVQVASASEEEPQVDNNQTRAVAQNSDPSSSESLAARIAAMPNITAARRSQLMNGLRGWATRGSRPLRLLNSSPSGTASSTTGNAPNPPPAGVLLRSARSARSRPAGTASRSNEIVRTPRPQDVDPLLVKILRVNKEIYKEARSVLYSENHFELDLDTALKTMEALHQRSRRQIRHIELTIPSHNEILERFAEVVRLSLRYCWGLKVFVINMPFTLPGADGSGTSGNTTVYANAFDILRWLPKQCQVILEGNVCEEIRVVVDKNANLAKSLDEVGSAFSSLCLRDFAFAT